MAVVALALEADRAWFHGGKVWLPLGGDWHLAISPDDAGRFRVEACKRGAISDTLWCLCADEERLSALAVEARECASALPA